MGPPAFHSFAPVDEIAGCRLDSKYPPTHEEAEPSVSEMQVDLVAVERQIWSGPAQMVVARTVDGDIGVMPGHAPLLAQLREGFAARIIAPDGTVSSVAVHGGFLSVTKDGVAILAEDAQLSDEIDVTAARGVYERAKATGTGSAEAEAELRRAQAQLLASGETV